MKLDIVGNRVVWFVQPYYPNPSFTTHNLYHIEIPEEDARKGMKDSGIDDWLVDAIMEFYSIIKAGHASKTTNVFEEVMRRNL